MLEATKIEKLLRRLKSSNSSTRDVAAAEIADWLDAGQLDGKEFDMVAQALMKAAGDETDALAKESIFNALSSASMSVPGVRMDWSSVTSMLESLAPDCLEHALLVLGYSGNPKYKSWIQPYLKHADKTVRETASEAQTNLDYLAEAKPKRGVKATKRN